VVTQLISHHLIDITALFSDFLNVCLVTNWKFLYIYRILFCDQQWTFGKKNVKMTGYRLDSWSLILGSSVGTFLINTTSGNMWGLPSLSVVYWRLLTWGKWLKHKTYFCLAAEKPQQQWSNMKCSLLANQPEVVTLIVRLIHSLVQSFEMAVIRITYPNLVRLVTLQRIFNDSDTSYLTQYKINLKSIHWDHNSQTCKQLKHKPYIWHSNY
jgi:hypothetical protein